MSPKAAPVRDDDLRRALESDLELLEATRLRYRALKSILDSWRWRARLKRNGELVREVVRAGPDVKASLARALGRARAEAWPKGSVARLLAEVASLEERVTSLAEKRLAAAAGRADEGELPGLGLLLGELELAVLRHAHGRQAPLRRRTAARDMVPATLPSLRAGAAAARGLEELAKRPSLAFSPPSARASARALREADAALAEAWARVARADATGSVTRFLERRARRVPLKPPRDGPDELIQATFWLRTARARVRDALAPALPGLALADGEVPAALEWLEAGQALPESLGAGRAHAFAFSRALGEARASAAVCAAWDEERWRQLERAASEAGGNAAGLRDALGETLRDWTRRPVPVVDLESLVATWRAAAMTARRGTR